MQIPLSLVLPPSRDARRSSVLSSTRCSLSSLAGLAVLLAASGFGLTGCGVVPATIGEAGPGASFSGKVMGGQQPIVGSTVLLVEPGTAGYAAQNLNIIAQTTSGTGGSFTLPAYTCPANSGLVYLLIYNGDAGAGTNNAISLAAVLGPCSGLSAATHVQVSEVTTVAAAYAMAGFATALGNSGTYVQTSATNLQGLYNTAGAALNLASSTNGFAHATGDFPGIVVPTAELNTLADILAACVNQSTTGVGAGTCATLFAAATPAGGRAPVDTWTAAVNIAQHPALNTAALYALVSSTAPFQPTLARAPQDFSVALGFNGGAISQGGGTYSVAIDAVGNAWVTTGGATNVHSLTEISPAGVYLSGSTVAPSTGFGYSNLSAPIGVSIDPSGSVFVANSGGGSSIQKFNTAGAPVGAFSGGSLTSANGIAVDGGGNIYAPTFSSTNNKLTKVLPNLTEGIISPFTTVFGGVEVAAGPLAVWESDYQTKTLARFDLTTTAVTTYPLGLSTAGVAIDHGNNAWFAATGDGNLYEISNTGVLVSPGPSSGGYVAPNGVLQNVAIDGLGNAFAGGFVQQAQNSPQVPAGLFAFSSTGTLLSGPNGFYCSGLASPLPQAVGAIDVDGSGNVWMAGTSNGSTLPNYVTEVIGIAAPVVTPRSLGAANNTLGTRP